MIALNIVDGFFFRGYDLCFAVSVSENVYLCMSDILQICVKIYDGLCF